MAFTYTLSNNQAPQAVTSLAVFSKEFTAAEVVSFGNLLKSSGTTSKNIKTDYGALGNGQRVAATITIGAASTALHVASSIFAAGDVGKYIAFGNDGFPSVGSAAFLSKIDAYVSGTQVTIHDAFTSITAVDGVTVLTSLSSYAASVEWGSDDKAAFTAFNAAYTGQSNVTLVIPDGRYCSVVGGGVGFGFGIDNLVVNGVGGSPNYVLSDMMGMGAGYFLGSAAEGQYNDTTHLLLVNSVSAGATVINAVNSSDPNLANFAANSWAILTDTDVQGFGYPSNQQDFEYVFITGIAGGALTLQSPLNNSYKSTLPGNWGGSTFFGGPATLYILEPNWNCTHTYNSLQLDVLGNVNCIGKSVTFNGGNASTSLNQLGHIYSSRNLVYNVNGFTSPQSGEMDKLSDTANFSGTFHGFFFQSPSPNTVNVLAGANITQLTGCGKNTNITSATIGELGLGPTSYGASRTASITNSVISTFDWPTGPFESDIFGAGAYTFLNGVFSRQRNVGSGGPPTWATLGTWCRVIGTHGTYLFFKILDMTVTGSTGTDTLHISTTLPANTFSALLPADTYTFGVHECPDFTITGTTGCDRVVAWSNNPTPHTPICSYWKLTHTGNIGTAQSLIAVHGTLVSMKINVRTAFSGGLLQMGGQFNNAVTLLGAAISSAFNPIIDLTQVGLRTITPTSVTGSLGSDNLGAAPGAVWLLENQFQPWVGTTISGGAVDVEIITNQGIAADTTPPTVPTGLAAVVISTSEIDLSWNASTDNVGVTGYNFYRNGIFVTTTAGTSYNDTGLSSNTTYSYSVSAFDVAGNTSAQCTPINATTLATSFPSFLNNGTFATATAASITPALPGSRVNGNLLVAEVRATGNTSPETISLGSGSSSWTIGPTINQGGAHPSVIAWRIIDGTETAPTFNITTLETLQAQIVQYAAPIYTPAPIGASTSNSGSAVTVITCGAIITTAADSLVVNIVSNINTTAPPAPAGWTSDLTTSSGLGYGSVEWASLQEAARGTNSGATSVSNTTAVFTAFTFEIRSQAPVAPPLIPGSQRGFTFYLPRYH